MGSVFRICPPKEQVLEWLQRLKIADFDDSHIVTESAFDYDEFNGILLELEPYYYPCKAIYLHRDMNMKRALTVLRQMVKPYGYTFNTRERLIAGNKINEYWLTPESAEGNRILNPSTCQITFT
jgi:hypothetical protein